MIFLERGISPLIRKANVHVHDLSFMQGCSARGFVISAKGRWRCAMPRFHARKGNDVIEGGWTCLSKVSAPRPDRDGDGGLAPSFPETLFGSSIM